MNALYVTNLEAMALSMNPLRSIGFEKSPGAYELRFHIATFNYELQAEGDLGFTTFRLVLAAESFRLVGTPNRGTGVFVSYY
jgi:hypothetical protein